MAIQSMTEIWCELRHETDLAVQIQIEDDDGFNVGEPVWVPKSMIGEDDWDREQELKGLREATRDGELWQLSIKRWWVDQQEWE